MRSRSVAGASGTDVYDVQNITGSQRTNAAERFRQAQLLGQQTPTSVAMAASGGHAQGLGGFGFGPGQQYTPTHMQGNTLQYQPEYLQDPQRQQQFTGYTSQMVHGVPQQVQPQSPYDNLPQFQPRQSAALEVSSTQFSVPQYYNPGDATSASVSAAMPQQYAPLNYQHQTPYQPASMNRPTLPQTFTPVMAGFSQAVQPEPEDQPSQSWEHEYEQRLRGINDLISNGRLSDAASLLLELSQWLLGKVGEFGLHIDVVAEDMVVHNQRLNMWTDFNHCWLALLQRQKEATEQLMSLDENPPSPDNLIGARFLERMGTELVRLCDNIERHGLVDYEMGVAEEEIINVLTECLHLLPSDEASAGPSAAAGSAAQS